jgi:hypothetical protein
MSAFYGTLKGAGRTSATRRGHKDICATAQSWAGSIQVRLTGDPKDPTAEIYVYPGSEPNPSRLLCAGKMSRLLKASTTLGMTGWDTYDGE